MVGRVFQAVARGLTMPMAFTIVLLEFPRERRGSAMGLVMLVVGFAPAIGPTLSGVLVQTVGWRMLLGLQLLNTTVGTWGLNALGNDAIQHAQATGNTLNQVAGSLVTAVVVSMTAFGAALAPAGDALAGYESGYHLGFVALLAVALVDAAVALFCIRERAGAQAARTARTAQAVGASGAQGADARTAGENAPGEKVARNMQPAAAGQTASDGALAAKESGAELVSDVMNRQPHCVAAGSTLRSVAQTPIETRTSGVPVVDRDRRVVGFVSDGDLLKYLGNEDRDLLDASLMLHRFSDPEGFGQRARQLLDLRVESVMTRSVATVEQDLPLGRACALLATKRIKKVPVVDAAGTPVGTLSRGNVVRSVLANLVTAVD